MILSLKVRIQLEPTRDGKTKKAARHFSLKFWRQISGDEVVRARVDRRTKQIFRHRKE